jgi:calcium/calmodulin-dependent protein kinase (CaM kinase) II
MNHDEPESDDVIQELLDLNQRLLNAIASGDWDTYAELCDPTLSCFEPEARGHLVEGLDFHQFYFKLPGGDSSAPRNTSMSSPHVRLMGEEAAVVSYVRLNQRINTAGEPTVSAVEETRVWERIDGQWRHVHFHRSLV